MINDHNCSQMCVEVEGSYNCSCYSGYGLQEDRVTCAGNCTRQYLQYIKVHDLPYNGKMTQKKTFMS